ncbi:TPA: site-specific DNA-methyltransferase, partial [Streptococcus suis]
KLGEYTQVEKLDLTSKDILSDNIAKIGQLFPEVLTESSDENGRLRPAIDFDKLRQFLSREIVEGRESYEFTWVGKRGAIAEAGKPTTQTLRPVLEESVDFDKSENVFITGDNLEVLKVLQESYLGKIDMIYIDPPYNTGKDFVYSDKFQMSEEELADEMDLRDADGLQRVGLTKNEKSSARYHSDWLNMMYPRLVLARNLLKDSGVIFISIDDNEQANLKAICDEIFGANHFVGQFPWRKRTAKSDVPYGVSSDYESILAYAKTEQFIASIEGKERKYFTSDDFPDRPWRIHDLTKQTTAAERPNSFFTMIDPKTGKAFPANPNATWRVTKDTFQDYYDRGKIVFPDDYDFLNISRPVMRYFKDDDMAKAGESFGRIAVSTKLPDDVGMSLTGTKEIKELFEDKYFDFPKPTPLMKYFLKIIFNSEALILDFFAGSATTADAVMQLNAEDGGNRKYILCTLDEQVADKSAAKEAGYETIDQISRERIRRAAKKIQEEHPERVGQQDFGFRAYRLDTSNFKDVSHTPDSFSQESLFDSISNIKEGRTDLDLLFQIMLTWGMELSLPIAKTQIDGTAIYNVEDGALIACFADEISESVLRQIAKEEPLRAVFKDESFANSAAKINLGQIFKEEAPNTKVKVV